MDEWKQRFKTYNITEEDLEYEPRYIREEYGNVKKNWFSVQHLSKIFDEDYSDEDVDQTERENDYRNEHENAVSDDEYCHEQCEDIDQTESEMDDKNESSSTDDDDTSTDYGTSTDDDDNLFQCKFCDEDFPTTTDKEAHEKKFHPTFNPDEKTILESTDD